MNTFLCFPRLRKWCVPALVLVATIGMTAIAHAQTFTFALNPATKSSGGGQTVIFQGTFANNTASTVFVNGLSIFFTSPTQAATIASASASLALPRSIAAGGSYTGDIFQVQLASNEPANNTITGDVTPQGGADADALAALTAAQPFAIVVIPETNTLALLVPGLLVGAAVIRRRARTA